ncbi:diguanylate cyclase (GGDEF)-like protein/PAS domain S-box-containing protein [Acetoanaerobium pronyense]|uniref:Diguanylate cyclase (GGDEF)-like protein/PAS domain S-box-containing protein n=1 Tax=Acetoanaerobium pronyense TaxID=1482736 RepID=A0ABS4KIE8_9FIRM|nr:diguanylate cyclase [Acetoanaerobium pronyense]MBP2026911.1 diguanylate cyclase (GGDEF)-like protein/PAS domain S-box-containing protein [Acetoanaerobium pronyense]
MPYREMDFEYILTNTEKPIFLLQNGKYIRCNPPLLNLFGYKNENELIGKTPIDISPKFQSSGETSEELGKAKLDKVLKSNIGMFEWTHLRLDGKEIVVRVSMTKIKHQKNDIVFGILDDITGEKIKERQIIENEKKFKKVFESMEEGMALCEMIYEGDKPLRYVLLDTNPAFERVLKVKKKYKTKSTSYFYIDLEQNPYIDIYDKVIKTKGPYKFEIYEKKYKKYFRVSAFNTEENMFATIFEDITQKKEQEEKIYFLTYHDTLTGLYNRAYYEEAIKNLDSFENLPLSILMIDVNGLKMANDTFGHSFGDAILKSAAEKIKNLIKDDFLAARIGGDEFVIIMPRTSYEDAAKLMKKIEENDHELVDGIEVSLSGGVASKKYKIQDINQIIIFADQQMYKKKQENGSEIRKKIIDKVLERLDKDVPWEKEHRNNVVNLSIKIGNILNLDKSEMKRLEKIAMFHNIGKVGIPKVLLKKSLPLKKEEIEIIKTHTEIGYRLLRSVPDYASIAEEVLSHHERIDGKGYPKGLSKDEIPFLTKIVSVACAYDGMVSERPYKKALSKEEAMKELIENSGYQFDSKIVLILKDLLSPPQ